jgi:hypothetical protein
MPQPLFDAAHPRKTFAFTPASEVAARAKAPYQRPPPPPILCSHVQECNATGICTITGMAPLVPCQWLKAIPTEPIHPTLEGTQYWCFGRNGKGGTGCSGMEPNACDKCRQRGEEQPSGYQGELGGEIES